MLKHKNIFLSYKQVVKIIKYTVVKNLPKFKKMLIMRKK